MIEIKDKKGKILKERTVSVQLIYNTLLKFRNDNSQISANDIANITDVANVTSVDNMLEDKIKEIEKSCYNSTYDHCENSNIELFWSNSIFLFIYSSKIYNILENIQVINQMIDAGASFANIGSTDIINSEIFSLEKEEILLRSKQVIEKKINKTIKCLRDNCQSFDIFREEVQTRSADEPATVTYICEVCGYKWRPK